MLCTYHKVCHGYTRDPPVLKPADSQTAGSDHGRVTGNHGLLWRSYQNRMMKLSKHFVQCIETVSCTKLLFMTLDNVYP
jgi:hypothetical protein